METTWSPGRPVPIRLILGALRHGGGDPTWRADDDGVWRACVTPDGAGTLNLREHRDGVRARAWGAGAAWLLAGLPELLGGSDDPTGFTIRHDVLREPARRHTHWRVCRSRLVIDSLVPAIIEQRVTGVQAFGAYRQLVRRFGAPAPGPGADRGLMTPPSAADWKRIPSWEWLRAGVDPARSRTIMRAVDAAAALERAVDLPREQAWARLRSVPGVGLWTAAETAQRALGDADAVSFGDYHVAKDIGWALTGAPVDDVEMARLLEPYAGHRFRVQFLVSAGGLHRPRRGPRITLPGHLPVR
ncbi:DNA-3-methyladenine glycosylase 2 family protein [Calidifontibacter sp. DB0510]|uniref:DNA-3-methyladenine glycosylase 2 family protein n=1 Tax=Metallococcus carri TaxID=1656884 RepID=A0A967E7W7_9MICO|nr:DNA-3-methyladenine glycosylase 2 family protein [Metallococcus carri]NOP36574.1 DNA-3-methyladenine glycosylase 2 family protein [Calidifontibacter sp. DB2511S]